MNVTHLSRLAYPFWGEGRGLGLRKKIIKKEKKSTWKVLTFVVYYRIHLNLNLEASARQWPNNKPHQFGGKSHPETTRTYDISVILGSQVFSEYEQMFPKSWDIRLFRLCSISNELD